jgi:hypothetical protein
MPRTKSPKTNGVKEAAANTETKPTAQAMENKQVNAVAATPVATEPLTKAEAKKPQAPKSPAPKLEAVRGEARNNVVPINLEEEIRRLAYLYSERRGFQPGHESEDWLNAEHEIMQRYQQHTAQIA